MAKYKSHKAALLGIIEEFGKMGFESDKPANEMTPDECEHFILSTIGVVIHRKDEQIAHLRYKVKSLESVRDTKEPERPKFVSPSQTHKTFWAKLKYILFE